MKSLSIRTKITLWFSVALFVIVGITFFITFGVSNSIIQKTIKNDLIKTVEHNVDEVEFYLNFNEINNNDVDSFLNYNTGFLEIDDDFLDEVNDVYTSLYYQDGRMLYGENPIAKDNSKVKFKDSEIMELTVNGIKYYIFDRKLTRNGLEGLWLRGVVAETQGEIQMTSIIKTTLVLMPMLVIIAIIGGYIIARKMLNPIQEISNSVALIKQGNDLKKRVEIGEGKDELHQLANNFNEMFERLETSFNVEKQFTSDVSHELRTPMSVIMAQCELTLEKERSVEEYEEALALIMRQGKTMTKLINDMLDYTRLELKSEQYEKNEINLSEICSCTCEDMALIKERGIILEYDIENDIFYQGNYELINRLLFNLISNAYRYGKDDGNIFVTLKKESKKIILSVRDNGIGIKKEEQDKIFNRFYQADNSRVGVGNGMGLAMVKEIVHFHNGEIIVESEVGKGSEFKIIFEK